MYKVAVCDDDSRFVDSLSNQLREIKGNNITEITGYTDVEDLIFQIEEGKVFDIIFMDIRFPNKNKDGIEYASEICNLLTSCRIIFVTSYNEKYSQQIFLKRVNLSGYLAKPVKENILSSLLLRAEEEILKETEESLLIETKKFLRKVPFRSISYIESSGHKVIIHSRTEDYSIYKKLDDLLKELPNYFVQCHKSYAINMNEIVRIENKTVYLRDQSEILISRVHLKDVLERFIDYHKEAK